VSLRFGVHLRRGRRDPSSAWSTALLLVALVAGAGRAGADPWVPLRNPAEIASENGVLSASLTVTPGDVVVGRKHVHTILYDGQYMPPLLRVQPGDRIRLHLVNQSTSPTNIHYHGFNVTPLGAGDNAFLSVPPNGAFDYDFHIPPDHAEGLYWYHPHLHPMVNPEIADGLSGGIIVGDPLAPFPGLKGITERVMLLKDLKVRHGFVVQDPDPSGPTLRTINGLLRPRVDIRPGELQFWRIGNIGANIFYRLKLPRHVFYVIAQDGRRKNQLVATKELLIPPAARYEVLVRGARPGRYPLKALPFDTGKGGDRYPGQRLATVVSAGRAVADPIPLPTALPPVPDFRSLPITGRRLVKFGEGTGLLAFHFTIDDNIYDHNRIDTTVKLGDVEEWTVQNTSTELHVFHIHQTQFQVTEINGVAQPFIGQQDTVTLPFATRQGGQLVPGEVKMIIPFTDPEIVGKFVYHCHIAQHADQGMMANIEVVSPGAAGVASPAAPFPSPPDVVSTGTLRLAPTTH
jgi:FtsP/CotA-like multicopper oxidase with cupredoxin domain